MGLLDHPLTPSRKVEKRGATREFSNLFLKYVAKWIFEPENFIKKNVNSLSTVLEIQPL